MFETGAQVQTVERPTRPVLRYHGGKWLLAPWIISQFPRHRIYAECFGGGGSVLIRKPRSFSEIYNDLDSEITNLFAVLRDEAVAPKLVRQIYLTPFSRAEFDLSQAPSDDRLEQARRTLVRFWFGVSPSGATGEYGTGYRTGTKSAHRMPARDWAVFPETLERIIERLRGVNVECAPADQIIRQNDTPETLFYVDPPYPRSTRHVAGRETMIYRHEMADNDHRELAEVLRSVRGMVVLSGYPCALYDAELYPDWHRVEREALADGARKRTECLWLNEAAASRQRQPGLFR